MFVVNGKSVINRDLHALAQTTAVQDKKGEVRSDATFNEELALVANRQLTHQVGDNCTASVSNDGTNFGKKVIELTNGIRRLDLCGIATQRSTGLELGFQKDLAQLGAFESIVVFVGLSFQFDRVVKNQPKTFDNRLDPAVQLLHHRNLLIESCCVRLESLNETWFFAHFIMSDGG